MYRHQRRGVFYVDFFVFIFDFYHLRPLFSSTATTTPPFAIIIMKLSIATTLLFLTVASARSSVRERMEERRGDQFIHHESTVDAIRDNHNRRMLKLEEMIEDRRVALEDHKSGRRLLDDEEFERNSRQYKNFQRKLEKMRSTNTDDHHRDRLEELNSLRNMNKMDF